jgi:hypothetical protein
MTQGLNSSAFGFVFLNIVKLSAYSWTTETAHFKTPRLREISKDNSGNMTLTGQALILFLIAFSSSWSYFILTYTFPPTLNPPNMELKETWR